MSTASTTIAAPPEVLYDLVADVTQMGRWSPETVSAEWVDADGPRRGAHFRGRNRRRRSWTTTCVVTEADRGRRFAFEVGRHDTRWAYAFDPVDGGTRVTESFEVLRQPGAVGRWLYRAGTGVPWEQRDDDLQEGMRTTLERLKAVAEGTSPAGR